MIMKKCFILLLPILLFSCSSSNDNILDKNSQNVELSDLNGTWTATNSSPKNLNGIQLILKATDTCVWDDKFGNTFSGPYYFISNISDEILKNQCDLIASSTNDKIHIGSIKINKYQSGNSELYLECDLLPFLPDKNWAYFSERVNSSAWSFWIENNFKYTFTIVEYTNTKMVLKLKSSDVRFTDYKKDYPLPMDVGENIVFRKY